MNEDKDRTHKQGLEVSEGKRESFWFVKLILSKKQPQALLTVNEIAVRIQAEMKYFRVATNSRLNFHRHLARMAPKIEWVAKFVERLLPNVNVLELNLGLCSYIYISVRNPDLV